MPSIESMQELRDWFYDLKLKPEIMANPYAMEAWNNALTDPSKGKIRTFYVMSGMDLYIEQDIIWSAC